MHCVVFQKNKLHQHLIFSNDDDGHKWWNHVQLTFLQSGSFVDFPTGHLAERRHELIESVKAMLH